MQSALPSLLDAESTALFVLDEPSGELWTPVGDLVLGAGASPSPTASAPPASLPPVVRVPAGAGVAGAAVQARTTVFVPEAYDDPRFIAAEKLTTRLRGLLYVSCEWVRASGCLCMRV